MEKTGEVKRDIIVIGGSTGGVEALLGLMQQMPKNLPATLLVVIHLSPASPSILPELVAARTGMKAIHPGNDQKMEKGTIYIAPPDMHLLVKKGHVILQRGPKENRHRPAVDPLFRSAATQYGPRVIGVILSGALDDGTAGLQAVKLCGGTTVVQHPQDAICAGMPESALRFVEVDHCVPLAKMGALLKELVATPVRRNGQGGCAWEEVENKLQEKSMNPAAMEKLLGPPSGYICPECQGPLWKMDEGKQIHFRCLVGHQYSPESLLADEAEALERALWVAVKTLEERSTLLRNLASRSTDLGQSITSETFAQKANETEEHAETIRNIVKRLRT